jgi:hypothetical protein
MGGLIFGEGVRTNTLEDGGGERRVLWDDNCVFERVKFILKPGYSKVQSLTSICSGVQLTILTVRIL